MPLRKQCMSWYDSQHQDSIKRRLIQVFLSSTDEPMPELIQLLNLFSFVTVWKLEELTREIEVTRKKNWFREREELYLLNSDIYPANSQKKLTKFIQCILMKFTKVLSDDKTEEFNKNTLFNLHKSLHV